MKKTQKTNNRYILAILTLLLGLSSCTEDYQPKPNGYFRIDLQDKDYQKFDNEDCPFTFEYPSYTKIEPSAKNPCWMNVHSDRYNATIHLTYKNISENMKDVINESIRLTYEHASKSDGIDEIQFTIDSTDVSGLIFDISGEAASDIQFIATDSANHFLRGALYFNVTPNQDSLAPLHNYFKEDIVHMIESLKWK